MSTIKKEKVEPKKLKESVSVDSIKEIIKDKIKGKAKIVKLDIFSSGSLIQINSELNAGFIGGKVKINGTLENKGDFISIKELNVEARSMTKSLIEGNLSRLVPEIKKYFEEKNNKEIKSMKIENGALSLEFK